MTGDKQSVRNWLAQAERPEAACNHFLQGRWRNIARAHLLLEEYAQTDEFSAFECGSEPLEPLQRSESQLAALHGTALAA